MARIEWFDPKSQRSLPLWVVVLAAALLAGRLVSCQMAPEEPSGERASADLVQWVPLQQARTVARQTGKPILYDFTAAWCGPCHQLEAEVFRNARLARMINDRFVPVRVTDRQREDGRNPEAVQELQQQYRVRAFPTIVVVDAAGTPRTKMEGFGGAERFEEMIRSVQ